MRKTRMGWVQAIESPIMDPCRGVAHRSGEAKWGDLCSLGWMHHSRLIGTSPPTLRNRRRVSSVNETAAQHIEEASG